MDEGNLYCRQGKREVYGKSLSEKVRGKVGCGMEQVAIPYKIPEELLAEFKGLFVDLPNVTFSEDARLDYIFYRMLETGQILVDPEKIERHFVEQNILWVVYNTKGAKELQKFLNKDINNETGE
ncbi:MAG: hypothetical protein GY861_25220 [bacterium]|nr:hypothetical protein [bacterium]